MARKLSGIVTSDAMDKTIVVTVTTRKTHPIYGKSYLVTKKFAAHDEQNQAHKGDRVEIEETRPISKNKSFKLVQVLEQGHEAVELKKTAVEEEIDAKLAEKEAKKAAEKEAVIASEAKQSSPEKLDRHADKSAREDEEDSK
jgi:small subunit ribosomal protein S17